LILLLIARVRLQLQIQTIHTRVISATQ
jgi:hypothetical protein